VKIVLAPGKFAGILSAVEAARAMAEGWRRARPADDLVLVPMADGGEGTIDVVEWAVPRARRACLEVADAHGHAILAAWLALPDGRALVEAAQACGPSRLAPVPGLEPRMEPDPLHATSYGVGQLLRAASAHHLEIVVGVGGSATADGGGGMATALGHRLLRADGNGVKVGGRFLADLDRIEAGPPLPASIVVASDVASPLLGPCGAMATLAAQHGAAEGDVPVLEAALTRLADVAERDLRGGPWRDLRGAGAAGGLGFGLAAFCGARLAPGVAAVAGLVGLDRALDRAAVVVGTGEGALDRRLADNGVPALVAALGRAHGCAVFAVADRPDAVAALGPDGPRQAAEQVAAHTAELARAL
jgi:glycerate kinase